MLGDLLKIVRIVNDIKVIDASRISGISSSSICQYEKNTKNIPLDKLIILANMYNIKPSELMKLYEIQVENNLDYKNTLLLVLNYYSNREKEQTVKNRTLHK